MSGKQKSIVLTFILSMFPGVGHYYLGLMNRGLQFMLFFVGGIVAGSFLDIPQLAAFLPAIWFYTLFDALQMAGSINSGEHVEDRPVIPWNRTVSSQKLIGWSLVAIGSYSLLKQTVPRLIPGLFFGEYFQAVIFSIVLIVVGVRILLPKKAGKVIYDRTPANTNTDIPNVKEQEVAMMANIGNVKEPRSITPVDINDEGSITSEKRSESSHVE